MVKLACLTSQENSLEKGKYTAVLLHVMKAYGRTLDVSLHLADRFATPSHRPGGGTSFAH
jgi:hypothetical protein